MLERFSDREFDQMKQQLIVPMAISDILAFDLPIESEMQYGLHMALSEVDPDSALLAIALCAHDLAAKCINNAPMATVLQAQAGAIIRQYGPDWMRHNINAPIPSSVYQDVLDTVPEDLESLAEILDLLQTEIDDHESTCFILAKLLSIQARAHMEIADFVLAEIAYENQIHGDTDSAPNFKYQNNDTKSGESDTGSMDNIIIFPGCAS